MAESSGDCLSKFKTKRDFSKEIHRDRRHNSFSNKYINDDDRRHSSSVSSRSESHRDSKSNSHDRFDRDGNDSKSHYSRSSEDRRVSYKPDDMYRRNASHSRRYEDDRNSYESKGNSYRNSYRDERVHNEKFIGSENRGTIVSNNRSNFRQDQAPNNERLVKYNNRNNVSSSEDELVASLFQKIDYLSNQVEFLTQENEKLRHSRSSNRNYLPDENSEVDIVFRDKHLEEKFLPILQELVSRLTAGDRSIEELRDFCSRPSLLEERELESELPEGDLFAVDNTTAEPLEENIYIPKYDTSFSEILQKEAPASEEDKSKSSKSKFSQSCFNCGGDHRINECPEKIDYRKVAEAKRQRMSRPTGFKYYGRYHVCGKESDFKPGVISKELRKAMDLASDQVPLHIYRMRILDYPPGWLQEAVVENSGISLYGLDGNVEKEENSENENGMQNSNGVQVQYDSTKFIDYPGFNVPLPPKMVDECFKFGLPPMHPHQMRSYVEQFMTKSEVCPKRKRKFTVTEAKPSKIPRVEEDMDVENDSDVGSIEFIPPLPEDVPLPPPPETITLDDSDPLENRDFPPYDSDSRSGPDTPMSDTLMETLAPVVERFKLQHQDSTKDSSPSLKDLEEIKKQLVLELGLASGSSSPAVQDGPFSYPSDLDSAGVVPLVSLDCSNDVSSFSDGSSASSPAEPGLGYGFPLKRTDSQCSQSKFVTLGTPSLSRHSSYQKLPEYDNFSKNVTSHMNFENLPNSTGTYQKMKKVIKKVKERFNNLMQ